MLKGSQLTAKQLAFLLVLVKILVELHNVRLAVSIIYESKLTWTFWTRGLIADCVAAKSWDSVTPPLTGDLLLLLNIIYFY